MLKPASLFTDGAVLCRGREIRVFGEADPGTAVRIVLTDRAGSLLGEAVCESSGGRFLAVLPPQQAQAGCRLTVSAGMQQRRALCAERYVQRNWRALPGGQREALQG